MILKPKALHFMTLSLTAASAYSQLNEVGLRRIDPFPGAEIGSSYHLRGGIASTNSRPCVDLGAATFSTLNNTSPSYSNILTLTSSKEVSKRLSLSTDAQLKIHSGSNQASLTGDLQKLSNIAMHSFSETKVYMRGMKGPMRKLESSSIRLYPDFEQQFTSGINGRDAFLANCGNYFIVAEEPASFYQGFSYRSEVVSTETNNNQLSIKVGFRSRTIDAKAELRRTFEEIKLKRMGKIEVMAISSEVLPSVSTPEELEIQFKNYMPTASSFVQSYYIAPYEYVGNLRSRGVLEQSQQAMSQATLLDALWDLKSLSDSARYVLRNEDLFALGLPNSSQRSMRTEEVKRLLEDWNNEYQSLLADTKYCIDNPSDQCAKLANWYDKNPRINMERLLPKKYQSLCYKPILIAQDPIDTDLQPGRRIRGDKEMAGGPVRVSTSLTIRPVARRLVANAVTSLRDERTNDHSTWQVDMETNLIDLTPEAGREDVFAECDFEKNPIDLQPLNADVYGVVSVLTPPNPRGLNNYIGHKEGLIDSIACVADHEGSDDGRVGCRPPMLRQFFVRLFNRLDIEPRSNPPSSMAKAPRLIDFR